MVVNNVVNKLVIVLSFVSNFSGYKPKILREIVKIWAIKVIYFLFYSSECA